MSAKGKANGRANVDASESVSVGRRALLKKAVATAPAIATVPSGAALARTSNLISSTDEGSAIDRWGRTLCLNRRYAYLTPGGSIDLGEPPYGEVTAIREREYRTEANGGADTVSEADMCRSGGAYYYHSYGWRQVNVPRGMLVSATALSSFAGSIVIRDV